MKLLNTNQLGDLAAALASAGYRVIVPQKVADVVRLEPWKPGAAIDLFAFPANSAKDYVFAASEVISRYTIDGDNFSLADVAPEAPKTVLLGVRPCEAMGLSIMDAVFNWDCKDDFYNARRAATTLVALACPNADDDCFCTSVGGAPDSTKGADAVLRLCDSGAKLAVESLTDKGSQLLQAAGAKLTDGQAKPDTVADVPVKFDARKAADWIKTGFDSPKWLEWSLACMGCAACAYGCPTCHCFDIQDESTRSEGVRLRNWDACGLALFTLHTSGHNPRADQVARWRNRVMHKFAYYPEKFAMLACTGCGRCARQCPAGMAILATLREVEKAEPVAAK